MHSNDRPWWGHGAALTQPITGLCPDNARHWTDGRFTFRCHSGRIRPPGVKLEMKRRKNVNGRTKPAETQRKVLTLSISSAARCWLRSAKDVESKSCRGIWSQKGSIVR